jgi:hypothetical protein
VSNRKATFKQVDLNRALRAMAKAGITLASIEIVGPEGSIVLIPGHDEDTESAAKRNRRKWGNGKWRDPRDIIL